MNQRSQHENRMERELLARQLKNNVFAINPPPTTSKVQADLDELSDEHILFVEIVETKGTDTDDVSNSLENIDVGLPAYSGDEDNKSFVYFFVALLAMFAIQHRKTQAELIVKPPRFAMFFAYFLPKKTRENVLGDALELYPFMESDFGRRRARLWFCWTIFASLWPLFRREVGRWLKIFRVFLAK